MKKNLVILFHPAIENQYYKCIPYSILSLERMLRDLPLEVMLIDENVNKDYKQAVEDNKERICLVGISSIIGSQIIGGIAFAQYMKQIDDGIKVLWGGWHSTILTKQTIAEDYIDFVVTGQGEKAFRALVLALTQNKDYSDIPNLCYKTKDNNIVVNEKEEFCNTNDFPPLNYDLVDINNYIYYPSFAKKSIVYFASQGCPYNCNFCAMATYYKQKWIPGKIEQIINDIKYFKEKAGIDSIFFQDDNFFSNKKFCLDLSKAFLEAKLDILWETWSHAGGFIRMFDDEDVALLYRAGCRQIIAGSESGSQYVLDITEKKLSVQDNYDFVSLLKKHGITPFFSIMLCFPEDPEKDIEETFEMIRRAKLIDNSLKIYFSFYTPYPGTKMYQLAVDKDFKAPETLAGWANHTFDDFHAPWWTDDYTKKLNIYAHFYIPFSNPKNYNNFPRPPMVKFLLMILNKVFYPLVYLRFKTNFFKFPVEAHLFLFFLKAYNKLFKKNYKLYPF